MDKRKTYYPQSTWQASEPEPEDEEIVEEEVFQAVEEKPRRKRKAKDEPKPE